jgi:hypothetical protein
MNQLEEHSKIAERDPSKVDTLTKAASEVISAVNECKNKFQDYKGSLS